MLAVESGNVFLKILNEIKLNSNKEALKICIYFCFLMLVCY